MPIPPESPYPGSSNGYIGSSLLEGRTSIDQRPEPIETLSVVTLAVENQAEALEWYRETLGFEVRADAPFEANGGTGRWLTVSPPGNAEVEIALVEPDAGLYDPTTLARIEEMRGSDPMWTFTTSDLDAAIEDLRGKGVEVDDEIRDTPWGRFGTLRDPDGNALQLYEPADPSD